MPHLVGVFLGNGSDGLPLFLHAGELVGCGTPVGAVFQSLGTLAESHLAFEIGGKHVLHLLEKLGLSGKNLSHTALKRANSSVLALREA